MDFIRIADSSAGLLRQLYFLQPKIYIYRDAIAVDKKRMTLLQYGRWFGSGANVTKTMLEKQQCKEMCSNSSAARRREEESAHAQKKGKKRGQMGLWNLPMKAMLSNEWALKKAPQEFSLALRPPGHPSRSFSEPPAPSHLTLFFSFLFFFFPHSLVFLSFSVFSLSQSAEVSG